MLFRIRLVNLGQDGYPIPAKLKCEAAAALRGVNNIHDENTSGNLSRSIYAWLIHEHTEVNDFVDLWCFC